MDGDPLGSARLDRRGAQASVVGRREAHVIDRCQPARCAGAVMEGGVAAVGAVDDLVDDHEVAPTDLGVQRSRGARREHRPHAQLPQRPGVGPVGNTMRGQRVVAAVPGEERHPPGAHGADRQRRRGRAERGVDCELVDILEQRVEARAPVDADVGAACRRRGLGHVPLAAVVDDEGEEDEDEED